MINLDIFKNPTQLISILNYENKKDDIKTSITDVELNQLSSTTKNDNIFMNLSYICHYKNKHYRCITNNFV